jgi:uncharacterized protein DUF3303
MLFMVIERFRNQNADAIGARFKAQGRMLPEGVTYHASWIDPAASRCFQVMDAADQESLMPWVERWKDLVDFEIIPVVSSADFWASKAQTK